MSEWQHIDSAPKDGTQVLVWAGGHRFARFVRGQWVVLDGDFWIPSTVVHWQPLPSPPPVGVDEKLADRTKALRGLMDAIHAVRVAPSPEEAADAMHDCVDPALAYAKEVLK